MIRAVCSYGFFSPISNDSVIFTHNNQQLSFDCGSASCFFSKIKMVKKHDKYELVECCCARSLHEIASDQLKYAITYFAIHFLFIFAIYFPFTFSISSLVLVFSPMSIVLSLSLCLWFIFGILAFRESVRRTNRDRAIKQIASEAWFSVEQIDTALYHRTCTMYIPYSILKYHKSKGMTHSFRPKH